MPIRQRSDEVNRATSHIIWLMENFPNVSTLETNLTSTFESFLGNVEKVEDEEMQHLAEANTRSRLRMVNLYYYSCIKHCLVLGTGNKVEDFGVGFCTKGGDSQVDISPIGDLMKSEVRALGKHMGINLEIVNAIPSDGLWDDNRGDEYQLKATYDELEWAMEYIENNSRHFAYSPEDLNLLSERQQAVLLIYKTRHFANAHKMEMPPICNLSEFRK